MLTSPAEISRMDWCISLTHKSPATSTLQATQFQPPHLPTSTMALSMSIPWKSFPACNIFPSSFPSMYLLIPFPDQSTEPAHGKIPRLVLPAWKQGLKSPHTTAGKISQTPYKPTPQIPTRAGIGSGQTRLDLPAHRMGTSHHGGSRFLLLFFLVEQLKCNHGQMQSKHTHLCAVMQPSLPRALAEPWHIHEAWHEIALRSGRGLCLSWRGAMSWDTSQSARCGTRS